MPSSYFVAYYDHAIAVETPKARDDIVEAVHESTEAIEKMRAARAAEARGFDIRFPGAS